MATNTEKPIKEKTPKPVKEKTPKPAKERTPKTVKEKVTKTASKKVASTTGVNNTNITTSIEETTDNQDTSNKFSINGLNKNDLKQQIIDSLFKYSPETMELLNNMQEKRNSLNEAQETINKKKINLSTQYIHKGKNYYYLNNEYGLNKDFHFSLKNNEDKNKTEFKVSMFLFNVNLNCNLPFLEFLVEMEENDKKLVLPSFKLLNSEFDIKEGEEPHLSDDPQTVFENICYKQFQEYTNVDFEDAKKAYKGYVELYDDTKGINVIFPVFECTNINFDLNTKQLWSVLDELLNEQHIYHYTIERNIFMVFINNEFLSYIKNEKGEQVTFPCCLYLVKKTDDDEDYENVYLDDDVTDTISIVDAKITHNVFGTQHFFTTDPIDADKQGKLKRYAAFVENSLYFLNISLPLRQIDLDGDAEDADEDEDVKTYNDYTSIYFFENYKQLWCINDVGRYTPL